MRRKNRLKVLLVILVSIFIMFSAAALLLAGSLIPGGCGIKKEKTSDSELPEIVIGIDYFEPYSYQTSDGEYKGIDVELAEEAFQRLGY
mgnify:CR=1 FL=1